MRRIAMALAAAGLLAVTGVSLRAQGTIPAGSAIVVSLDQAVSSKDAHAGQKLQGSVARAVIVKGRTAIPKGARVNLSVASVQASGRLKTPAKLWLKIDSIVVRGKTYRVSSRWSGQTGPAHNKRNVVAIGGGTAAGALIGALAGGGKGAAIGAAVGAGAGTAGAAMTGKKDITYPPETRLRFTLKSALAIR